MSQNRKPTFLVTTTVETSAALNGSGFTSGEVGFFLVSTSANTGTSFAAPVNPFFAVQKPSDATKPFMKSPVIPAASSITKLYRKDYVAPVAQVEYLGYAGTGTDTLSYDCETTYGIRVVFNSPYIAKYYNRLGLPETYHITTECCTPCDAGCGTASPLLETAKFVKQINGTSKTANFIGAEIVTDASTSDTVAVWTDASTATFTYGSATVTTSAANTLAAGDYIRVSIDGDNPTTDTDPVYKVAAIVSSTQFTLDTTWQNATVTANLDTTLADSEVSKVTTASVSYVGIKWTSKFISISNGCCCFPPFPFDFEGVSFGVYDTFDASWPCSFTTTASTALNYGNGSSREMIYMEMDAFGYTDIREWFRDCASNTNYTSNVVSTTNYDTWYMHYSQNFSQTGQGDYGRTDYVLIIAMPTGTGSTLNTIWTNLASRAGIAFTTNP